MSFPEKAVIDEAAEYGDLEDAHIDSRHQDDMFLVRPYYHETALFCYLASVGHRHDLGGAVPGNCNPTATDAFQGAMRPAHMRASSKRE